MTVVVPIRKLRDKLIFESKFADKEHERDIAEGHAYKSIKEVRVDAISSAISREISKVVPR